MLQKTNEVIIEECVDDLEERNKSEHTERQYRTTLNIFFSECKKPISEINYDDVFSWLEVYSEGKTPATINCRLSVLKNFFEFCVKKSYLSRVPIRREWIPRLTKMLPKFLSEQDRSKILLLVSRLSLRDQAIIYLLDNTALRRSELSNLLACNVDLDGRNITIHNGKGQKDRVVHFNEQCAYVLSRLPLVLDNKNDYLITKKSGKGLTDRQIYNIVRDIGEKAGSKLALYPHLFRSTYVHRMLSKGAPIEFLKEELGHKNFNTIKRYGQPDFQRLKSEYERVFS